MVLLKFGLKNLKHNAVMNILMIFQMTIVLVITVSMVSTIVSRFSYYTPIKNQLCSKGYFYCIDNAMNPETGLNLRTTDELHDLIEGENEISASYNAWLTYSESEANFISYDDRFIGIFTPKLESGGWFDLGRKQNDTVQVVVSQNANGFKVGDAIKFDSFGEEINGEIIGILSSDTKVIGFTPPENGKCDCRSAYMNYNYEIEEKPLFLFAQSELCTKNIVTQLDGPVFITYDESVPDDIIEKNNSIIKKMMTINITPLNDMRSNSMEYIFSQMLTLFPILICVLILTIVGGVSVSALSAKYQLKNYAVFYCLGLRWRQCALVNLYSSLICAAVSFVLSIAAVITIKFSDILGNSVIDIGIGQLLSCLVLLVFYIALSILLPLKIIGDNTPSEVLRAN